MTPNEREAKIRELKQLQLQELELQEKQLISQQQKQQEEANKPNPFKPADKIEKAFKPGELEAFTEGLGKSASLGYLPQLQAAAEPVTNKLMNLITGQNVETSDYVTRRDENIKRQKELAQEHPKATAAGNILGLLTTSALPGLGATKGVLGATKAGGIMGAVYNPGDEQGKVDPLQLEQRAKEAALGAVGGAAVSGLGKAALAIPQSLKVAGRSVLPETLSRSGYMSNLEKAIQKLPEDEISHARELFEGAYPKGQDTNRELVESLKELSPQIKEIIAQKSPEMMARELTPTKLGGIIALISHLNPSALAAMLGARAGTAGSAEMVRQLATKPGLAAAPQVFKGIEEKLKE